MDLVRRVIPAAVVLALACACAPAPPGSDAVASDVSAPPSSTPSAPVVVRTEDYLPGLAADVRLPSGAGAAPLVVLVPGGGWETADRSGLVPLAEALTASGAVTATITYGTTSTGALFPVPADDVACAVRWAAATATSEGRAPSRVVVLGHSAGGHLAALVGLSGQRFGGTCPAPPTPVDGVVGLAGVYDAVAGAALIEPFFGVPRASAATAWREGDPLWWATDGKAVSRRGPRVLLVQGDADLTVPVTQTRALAAALDDRGAPVQVEILPGGDHGAVLDPVVVAPLVTRWLAGGAA